MKSMTCKQLGGACDMVFRASGFDDIAEQSKKHGMEMFFSGDEAHQEAIRHMMKLVQDPAAMQAWMDEKRKEFDALPDEA